MSKKKRKDTSIGLEHVPGKHQLSKWQRQEKIRRLVIIAAAVLLAGVAGSAGYGYYDSNVKPFNETVIGVNNSTFDMRYYIEALDVYTRDMSEEQIRQAATPVGNQIVYDALVRQGASEQGVELSKIEVDDINRQIEERGLPDTELYHDILTTMALVDKLAEEYLKPQIPNPVEQAHIQTMLVESEQVADEVIAQIENGGNFTALTAEFSQHPQIEGDLGWLPRELLPGPLFKEVAFNLTPGKIGKVQDDSAVKNIGYWLIEVIDQDRDDDEEEVEVRAMLLGSEAEALEIKAKLDKGEDFASLAKEHSQHQSKDDDGELGWIKKGDMGSETFDIVAFHFPLNEISKPVKDKSIQTTGGYWVIKVVAREERELDEKTLAWLIDEAFNKWYEEQWGKSTIDSIMDAEQQEWAINKVLKERATT